MKILIIVPRTARPGEENRKFVIPVGLAYVSAVLKENGHEVNTVNLNLHTEPIDAAIKELLTRESYTLMLTGGLSTHYSVVRECFKSVRRYSPQTRIVLGGGLLSSRPKPIFNALQPDYAVIGEGELTIVELLRSLTGNGKLEEIDGIGYRDGDGSLVLTRPRKAIENLDSLPWPDFEGVGLDMLLEQIKPSTLYYYDVLNNPRPYPLIASRSLSIFMCFLLSSAWKQVSSKINIKYCQRNCFCY